MLPLLPSYQDPFLSSTPAPATASIIMPALSASGDPISAKVKPNCSNDPSHKAVATSINEITMLSLPPSSSDRLDDFPTTEDLATLPRVPGAIPWKLWLVAKMALCERFAYAGVTAVFTNFIANPLSAGSKMGAVPKGGEGQPGVQPGALGLGQRAAAGIVRGEMWWVYVFCAVGAWIADTRLGRFKTLGWSVGVATVGYFLMTGAASPGLLEKPDCALLLSVVGLVIVGLGTGSCK
jgi:POT family proton-dependent oligopeptide transporter